MADIYDKAKRSEIMAKVHSKDTRPELTVRRLLHKLSFRFTINSSKNLKLPGKPDMVLPKYKLVIFVHGCFWHLHKNCKKARLPKSNKQFWKTKLESNVDRDTKNQALLKEMGWNVVVIWECQTVDEGQLKLKIIKEIDSICWK